MPPNNTSIATRPTPGALSKVPEQGTPKYIQWAILQRSQQINALQSVDMQRLAMLARWACEKDDLNNRGNGKLKLCSPGSWIQACYKAAILGLDPDGIMGAFLPYKNSVDFQPMVQGLVHLARQHPDVTNVRAREARAKDDFDFDEGNNAFIKHKRFLGGDRGELIAAYCIIDYATGRQEMMVVEAHGRDGIYHSRDKSAGYRNNPQSSPWTSDEGQMACKTVAKRAMKFAPKTERLNRALLLDNAIEKGAATNTEDIIIDVDVRDMEQDADQIEAPPQEAQATRMSAAAKKAQKNLAPANTADKVPTSLEQLRPLFVAANIPQANWNRYASMACGHGVDLGSKEPMTPADMAVMVTALNQDAKATRAKPETPAEREPGDDDERDLQDGP